MASPNDIPLFDAGPDGNNIRLGRTVGGGPVTWVVPAPVGSLTLGSVAPAWVVTRVVPAPGGLTMSSVAPTAMGFTSATSSGRRSPNRRRR